jgi:hypothetical protein
MDGNRAEVLSIITLNQQKPINEYSMGKAVKNLTDYYNAGTLVRAFTQLSRDTANKTQASEDAVRIIRGEDITPSTIRTAQEADISKELLRQRRVLAKKLADARSIVVPSAAAGDTQARTDEIARIKTEKDEKLKAARLKLEEVWSEVEANEKFKPIVQEMKADPAFAGIFAALQTPGTTDEAAAKHYLDLINGLTTKIRDNSELRRELLAILRTVNQ